MALPRMWKANEASLGNVMLSVVPKSGTNLVGHKKQIFPFTTCNEAKMPLDMMWSTLSVCCLVYEEHKVGKG